MKITYCNYIASTTLSVQIYCCRIGGGTMAEEDEDDQPTVEPRVGYRMAATRPVDLSPLTFGKPQRYSIFCHSLPLYS